MYNLQCKRLGCAWLTHKEDGDLVEHTYECDEEVLGDCLVKTDAVLDDQVGDHMHVRLCDHQFD